MPGQGDFVGGENLYLYSLATQAPRAPLNVRESRRDGPASPPPTFIVSHDGFSPPEPGRKRRRYTDEERRQVAAKRKEKACEEHRATKTKCTCVPPNSTRRYLKEGERHEKIALGLISNKEHMKELERDVERNLATMDKSLSPKSQTRAPKIKSERSTMSQTLPLPLPSKEGSFGYFRVSSSPMQPTTVRPSPKLSPKGPMSPPISRRPAPPAPDLKSPSMGGTPMARGDSGYSYYSMDSVPTLANSGMVGTPSTQFSPPQNPIPYSSSTIPRPGDSSSKLLFGEYNGHPQFPHSSLPNPNNHGFTNNSGTGLADPLLFPSEDDGDFAFEDFLNESSFF